MRITLTNPLVLPAVILSLSMNSRKAKVS